MARSRSSSTLEPFGVPNFAWYFTSQVIASTGFWFQNLTLTLVVLEVTGSAQALSLVTIVQLGPILLLSLPAGWLADRVAPRTILLCTTAVSAIIAVLLAVVVASPQPELPIMLALIAIFGSAHAFERVAAQAIMYELVGAQRLARGAALGTTALAVARSIGPGLAGFAFQSFGAVFCMLVDAGALVLVFISISLIRVSRLHARERPGRDGSRRERFPWTPDVVTILLVNSLLAFFAFNLMLVLTSMVTLQFEADAGAVGVAHGLNAVGGIFGGLVAARFPRVAVRALALATLSMGIPLLLSGLAPNLLVFMVLGPVLGFGVGYYQAVLYSVANASVPPASIGRIMSFVTLGHYGVMPFGAILAGFLVDEYGAPSALFVGGAAGAFCALLVAIRTRKRPAVDDAAPGP